MTSRLDVSALSGLAAASRLRTPRCSKYEVALAAGSCAAGVHTARCTTSASTPRTQRPTPCRW